MLGIQLFDSQSNLEEKNIYLLHMRGRQKEMKKKKLNGFREVYHVIYIFQN